MPTQVLWCCHNCLAHFGTKIWSIEQRLVSQQWCLCYYSLNASPYNTPQVALAPFWSRKWREKWRWVGDARLGRWKGKELFNSYKIVIFSLFDYENALVTPNQSLVCECYLVSFSCAPPCIDLIFVLKYVMHQLLCNEA